MTTTPAPKAFAQAMTTVPEQTQRIRERIAVVKAAEPTEALSVGGDMPLDQIEAQLKREQAARDAADAQRAEIERRQAYQENRPVAIRQRLAVAQEEQEAIGAALQAELAGDTRSAPLVQAQRWGLETRYVALSSEMRALDQELLSLPMRLELLAARRAEETANFKRAQTAKEVGVPALGLGELLLEHQATLPDFGLYARRASAREREIASVNLTRLRHLEEAERLADPSADSSPALSPAGAAAGVTRNLLLEQRRGLLERQLEAEADYLERLRKLQGAETRMLEAAWADDAFLKEQLFWLPVGAKTRLADLDKLPAELRVLLASETWSEPAGIFVGQVTASPLFWLTLLLSAALLWKRRALAAAIQATANPLANPDTDRFGHTLRALVLTLALAAPLALLLGVGGWMLLGATQGTALSLALGAYLVRLALILYVLLVLRALCLPGGVAMAHLRWSEPDVRRLGWELRWLTWILVPALVVGRIALALNPAEAGGLVMRLALLSNGLTLGLFFYRVLHPRHGLNGLRPSPTCTRRSTVSSRRRASASPSPSATCTWTPASHCGSVWKPRARGRAPTGRCEAGDRHLSDLGQLDDA